MKALGKSKSTKVSKNLLYNKGNSFILQSTNVKYNKPFKLYIYINIYIYIYIYICIYINRVIMAEYTRSKNVSTTVFFNLFSLTH